MKRLFSCIIAIILVLVIHVNAHATQIFFDDFDSGPNSAWGNETGAWTASGGVYNATSPSNSPPAYSSVTSFSNLTDFTVEVDVNSIDDGGIFLRSQECSNGQVNGLLLLTGGFGHSYNGLYWHQWDCNGWGAVYNQTPIAGFQGSNQHVKIVVQGDTYSAYLGNSTTPVSTLVTNKYSSGAVGLYDFSNTQTFDNLAIYTSTPVPEPSTNLLLGFGLIGLIAFRKRYAEPHS